MTVLGPMVNGESSNGPVKPWVTSWGGETRREVYGEDVNMPSLVCASSIFLRLSKLCGYGQTVCRPRAPPYRRTNVGLSWYVAESHPLAHPSAH